MVHTPICTRKASRPGTAWLASTASASSARLALRAKGSGRSATSSAEAATTSAGVLLRMKTGLLCHITVSCVPGSTPEMSTWIDSSASTSADGSFVG
jgi:hypothetical protein